MNVSDLKLIGLHQFCWSLWLSSGPLRSSHQMYWTAASAVGPASGRGTAPCPRIYKQCDNEIIQMLSANTFSWFKSCTKWSCTLFMDLTPYSLILHKLDRHYLKRIILNLWGSHFRNKLLFICKNYMIVWLTHWWWRTWTLDRAQADS